MFIGCLLASSSSNLVYLTRSPEEREADRWPSEVPFPSPPPNPIPQSHPQLCSRPSAVASLPLFPHLQQITQTFSYRVSASSSLRHSGEKQEDQLQIHPLLPLLHTQLPSLIPSSGAGYGLWLLLPLCPHSKGAKWILVEHLVFLLWTPSAHF